MPCRYPPEGPILGLNLEFNKPVIIIYDIYSGNMPHITVPTELTLWRAHSCACVFLPLQVISAELRSSKHWELTGEGSEIAEQGSHEARVFSSVPLEGLPQNELMVSACVMLGVQNLALLHTGNQTSIGQSKGKSPSPREIFRPTMSQAELLC